MSGHETTVELPVHRIKIFSFRLLALAALLSVTSCDSTNPVEPPAPQTNQPGSAGTTVAILSDPEVLPTGDNPAVITVTVDPSPGAGKEVALSTSLGSFNVAKPVKLVTLTLDGQGQATAQLYPGTEVGTANLLAQFENTVQQLSVPIREVAFYASRITPNTGNAEGGYNATIRGGGFLDPVRVQFGSVVSPRVRVLDEGTLDVVVPRSPTAVEANTTLTVDIVIVNAIDRPNPSSSTLAGGFTYTNGQTPIDRPVVFSVDPGVGPNEGGQKVVITGSFLPPTRDAAQVLFGLNGASFEGLEAQVTSASPTRLEVITPRAAGIGAPLQNMQVDVLVRNLNTGFFTVASGIYRYGDDLFITSVSPLSAPYQGGTSVTINGRGFRDPVEVRLAGVLQTLAQPASRSQIRLTTGPVAVSGCNPPSGPIAVTNLTTGQTVTSNLVFSFTVVKPFLQKAEPSSSPAAGGGALRITGTFPAAGQNLRLKVNGGAVPILTAGTGEVTATIPAYTGAFEAESCTTSDGFAGTRSRAKAVDVEVLDTATGCSDSLPLAFTYQPSNTACVANPAAPVANFIFNQSSGSFTAKFFDQSTGGRPTAFSWQFGDGRTSTLEDPEHTYAVAGVYTVTLTVSNSVGSSSISKEITVPFGGVSP